MSSSGFSSAKNRIGAQLSNALADLNRSSERLSSGSRINRARDDAAGLAIADALRSESAVVRQANRNISDAQSMVDIADSAMAQVSDISVRMQELAAQSANGTLSDAQRSTLQAEYNQLGQEVQRIAATTEFNGKNVFSGSSDIQVGSDSSADSRIAVNAGDLSALAANAVASSISNVDQARASLETVSTLVSSLSSARGSVGAQSVRLDAAAANNSSAAINLQGAESRIRDADVADEVAQALSAKIRTQTGTALYAQVSRTDRDRVLDLLR